MKRIYGVCLFFFAMLCVSSVAFAEDNFELDDPMIELMAKGNSPDWPRVLRGDRGHRGHEGHRGHRGHKGKTGAGQTGPAGPAGQTGPAGAAGAIGPTGPSGGGDTYLSAVANDGSSTQSVTPGNPVLFNALVASNNIVLTGMTNIIIPTTGVYEVSYGGRWGSATAGESIILKVNGVEITASKIAGKATAAADWAATTLIISLTAGDSLFVTAAAANTATITFTDQATNIGQTSTSAFVTVTLLNAT